MFSFRDFAPQAHLDLHKQKTDQSIQVKAEGGKWFTARARWFRRDFGDAKGDIEEKDRTTGAALRGGPVGRQMPLKAAST